MRTVLRRLPLALAVAEKAIREFSNQWLAGLQPQLSLETGPDGQVWVNSRVAAGDVPTQALVVRHHAAEAPGRRQAGEAGEAVQRHPPRRHGPSYQRRLLRRAAAPEAAATADEAVQTAVESVEPVDEAVQVAVPPTQQVAAEVLPAPANQQNFWSSLRDELCPDRDYSAAAQGVLHCPPPYMPHLSRVSSQNIPQVDGSTHSYHPQHIREIL
jgi:hypothetical protein